MNAMTPKESAMPVCKHGYRGDDCPSCYHEKYVVVERDKYLSTIKVLRDILKSAGLTAGYQIANQIIEQETLK